MASAHRRAASGPVTVFSAMAADSASRFVMPQPCSGEKPSIRPVAGCASSWISAINSTS
jgi:hypothetical protein